MTNPFKKTLTAKDLTVKQVLSATKNRSFPSWKQWMQLSRVITQGEGQAIRISLLVMFLSIMGLGTWYVATHRTEIPAVGGEYVEAIVGEPQYINPLYASSSDVDSDLTKLVYSGLLKWDPEAGLVNDLASEITVSEDGKTYTVTVRDNATFHNGDPVTAADVLFTIEAIQNPQYRSPLAVSFRGVTGTQTDDKTLTFQLEQPFAPFLSTLTVGILPSGIWENITPRNAPLASRNLEPIGSGPYRFSKFSKDKQGVILSYTLSRNADYYDAKPFIQNLVFKFYADPTEAMEALAKHNVEGVSFVPADQEAEIEKNRSVALFRPSIPRETVLIFNQAKQEVFKKIEVRRAIAMALNKQTILDRAINGHGIIIDGPILPGMLGEHKDIAKITQEVAGANKLLEDAGFPLLEGKTYRQTDKTSTDTELTFTLTTVQSPEFVNAAEEIASELGQIGIKLTVNALAPEDFFGAALSPRAYELLLTGELLGIDPDLYPYWHSSQAVQGGLNLADYANRKADTLLEEARTQINPDERAAKYREFQDILAEDLPAVFLYQSTYALAIASKIKGVEIDRLATPSDRFANVTAWYSKTKKTLK